MTKTLVPTAIVTFLQLTAVILLMLLLSSAAAKPSGPEPPSAAEVWRLAYDQSLRDRDALAKQGANGRQLEDADALIYLLRAKVAPTRKEPRR